MASLRWRLLVIFISIFVLAWFLTIAGTGLAARRSINELFDAQLAHDAGVLLALSRAGVSAGPEKQLKPRDIPLAFRKHKKTLAFQIWRGNQLLLRSQGAPNLGVPGEDGYQDLMLDDHHWRAFTTHSPDNQFTVWVGERFLLRRNLTNDITWDMLFPLLLAVPLLAVAIGWGVGRGLVPLRRVAAAVARRSPSNLQPVDMQKVPAELKLVIETLNSLLVRLQDAFDRERRFTSDAAHEIRTPLAGIKTHAQVALRQENDLRRRQAMEEVIQGVDRTTRLVEQLLTLARLDNEALVHDFQAIDLESIVVDVITALDPEASARRTTIDFLHRDHGPVNGNPMALSMMIRNLVDNAVRYTPEGGTVQVEVGPENGQTIVSVTDNGPGVPEEEKARIFDRFYRGRDTAAYGCGLGLSIVKRVADVHGASVSLATAPSGRGLRVRVALPAPRDTTDSGFRSRAGDGKPTTVSRRDTGYQHKPGYGT
jgi:two-component system sensor histidine kinase QseC